MKKIISLVSAVFMLVACGGNGNNTGNNALVAEDTTSIDIPAEAAPSAPISVKITGDITPDAYNPKATATVEFDRFPVSVDDFKAVQKELGGSIAGAVALNLMAYQIYYYDQKSGEEAIKLCNCSNNVYSTMSVLKQKFRKEQAGKDSYCQPWLVATYLDGATPKNAYAPTKPYTIKLRTSPVQKYETVNSPTFKGWIYTVQVYTSGADTAWRTVEVCKEKGKEYLTMFNCPNLYVGVKEIDLECDEEFQELH